MNDKHPDRPGTIAVHGDSEARGGAAVAPIYQAVTFAAGTDEEFLTAANRDFSDAFYTRYGNPNHSQVGELVGELEGTERAIVTASGMGALSTLALSLLSQGDHVVLQRTTYPGTAGLATDLLRRFGVTSSVFAQGDLDSFVAALRPETRLVLLESPSNPLLDLTDIRRCARLAHDAGALVAVDNTVATPINQRPHSLGADLVWHSATKYLSGHSDVSAGVIAGPNELIEQIWRTHLAVGSVLGPFDAWLLLRGLRTLDVRMQRHNDNAMALARMLSEHAQVESVFYPGLPSHPQSPLAREQMTGFGGLLSFSPSGGPKRSELIIDNLRLSVRAASLGSVHTITTRPSAMWSSQPVYRSQQPDDANDALIRVSVGIEDVEDLLEDFDHALLKTTRDG
ncbi:MAG: trans-sulfuration enzyme family protein [Acidimicrobiales bacterium]